MSREDWLVNDTFQCPNCGAPLDIDSRANPVIRCPYCSSGVVVPENLRAHNTYNLNQPGITDEVLKDLLQPETLAKIKEIKRLVQAGQKIEAIKQYREVFKTSLKEAKDAIDQLAEGKPIAITYTSNQPAEFFTGEPSHLQVKAEIRQILQEGNKIEAIRHYREIYKVGLKEAKDAIDRMQETGVFAAPVSSGSGFIAGEIPYQTSNLTISGSQAAKATAGVVGGISCFAVLMTIFIILVTTIPILFALASHGGPLEGVWNQINPIAYARVAQSVGEEGSGPGFLDDPRAIAVDPSGNIFVANYSDGRIQKFDPSGDFVMLWNIGSEKYVTSMTVDRAGNVYAVYRGEIWKYNGSDGQLIGQLVLPGNSRIDEVIATADGGLVAALNTEDYWRYDSDGQIVFSLAEVIAANTGDPEGVEAIAVDGVGNVFLLGDSTQTIYKYSADGKLLARFGSSGDEPGQFRGPLAMTVDGQGRVYVSDIKGIQVFAPDGRYLDRISVEGVAFSLAFSDQGDLWVTTNKPRLLKYRLQR
jgi:ribosomal protein L7/L12/sugar lactone lactonase YvrE/DNA-directed RNA polymerase subunit RPC12/RpoP